MSPPRIVSLQQVLLVLLFVLSLCTESSDAKFSFVGSAYEDASGFTRLTNTKKHVYGQAFEQQPLAFKNSSSNATATSFTVNFFFAIAPEKKKCGSHGMAFVISPTKGIPGAFPDQYLGVFNDTNNGKSSNHVIAVELDIHKDDEFGDIDDNHVGININGLRSVKSAPAGYYDKDGNFRNLSLISETLMRLSVIYSQPKKELRVTLSPVEMVTQPEKPLLSLNQDLSPYLLDEMYVGFSASTGSVGTIHYIWGWHIDLGIEYRPRLELNLLPVVPPYPRKASESTRKIMVVCLSFSMFVALVASALGIFLYLRHKKVKEVLEEWEIQYGPHRFSFKELFKATKGFKDKQLLGKGGFGQVYKGTLPGTDAEIAVKRISHNSKQGMREFLAEISTIGRLRHPSLVRLLGYCRHQSLLYLIYDFMPNGSLDKFLYPNPGQEHITWDQRFKILKDVASALFYLHHQWVQVIIHRDIKPENVLIDLEWNARLGDFGLAKLYEQGYDPQTTYVAGTFGYMAPELVITGKATTGTDVYAFGLFMLEVACGRRPIMPRAPPREIFLVDLILDCWEKTDILEAVDERLRQELNREQLELVLKLGILCAHGVPAARPAMSSVIRILDGVTQLPNNLLDILKVGRYEGWSDTSEEVLDVVSMQSSLTLTEPFTSRGR
ncbi:PREDICTED: L-type lectin-domain containing receptor kinase V.4-like [Tarenaya hassleriana]|uniref:L-type lectin-domain containing receptor kinase V.4-like n=1 Tax=Tarenaya hassleriana TaxID=28532 RepID=UPI00053C31BF|nr:PREDICTED: L-type lectin-domain containing receptor kinase V.4-like [Tarenaya hassleriana]